MAHVITQTYCAFCDAVTNTLEKCMGVTEGIGRARAASALAEMGYYKEAKKLMMEKSK